MTTQAPESSIITLPPLDGVHVDLYYPRRFALPDPQGSEVRTEGGELVVSLRGATEAGYAYILYVNEGSISASFYATDAEEAYYEVSGPKQSAPPETA